MADDPDFLAKLEARDAEFADQMRTLRSDIRKDGALSGKTKTLMAMALDAGADHPEGVKVLADAARDLGATEEEVLEAVEVSAAMCGIQGLVVGMEAFEE